MTLHRWKVTGFSASVLILIVGIILFVHTRRTPLTFNVQPLPKSPRTLTATDVERLLGRDFQLIRDVRQIPTVVRQDFSTLAAEPFQMVNTGQEMSTDMIIPGVPNKRLVFAAVSNDTAVLVYELGGYVGTLHAMVFCHANGGGGWKAMLDEPVHDIASLRNTVQRGHFTISPVIQK